MSGRLRGLAGKQYVDIGCGGGILTEALAQRGALMTGIDMAEQSLKVARLHLHESDLDIDYQLSTAEAFAEHNAARFDVVACLEMLEHVPDPAAIIDAAVRLLKPGRLPDTVDSQPQSKIICTGDSRCRVCTWADTARHPSISTFHQTIRNGSATAHQWHARARYQRHEL